MLTTIKKQDANSDVIQPNFAEIIALKFALVCVILR